VSRRHRSSVHPASIMIQPYLSDSSAMALVQFLEPRCEMRMTEFPDADDDLALNEVDKGTDGGTVKEDRSSNLTVPDDDGLATLEDGPSLAQQELRLRRQSTGPPGSPQRS